MMTRMSNKYGSSSSSLTQMTSSIEAREVLPVRQATRLFDLLSNDERVSTRMN
jgi:hypothetical protein